MKKIIFTISLIIFFQSYIFSQEIYGNRDKIRKCGTAEYMNALKASNPSVEMQMQQLEEYIRQWIKENPNGQDNKTQIIIPVVVHLLYANSSQDISDARVQEQIDMLNRDYGGNNTHSMGAFDNSLKANTEINFCLARRTPSGAATSGIERKQTSVNSFSANNKMKFDSTGGLAQWDPYRYFNIWVCNLDPNQGLCGYAEMPSLNLKHTFGVVIHYQYFGKTGASYPYNDGGTTTHEVGHCLNLYHIWGDDGGSCQGTDYCDDTPAQSNFNYTCHTGVFTDSCSPVSPGIMYMNFMDYTDDACYANFTPCQKNRMQALFASGALLDSLAVSDACMVGIADFNTISGLNIYPNPAQSDIFINFGLEKKDDVVITITNIIGEVIAKSDMQNVSSVNISFDISANSPGIYFIKIQSGKHTITEKICLLR